MANAGFGIIDPSTGAAVSKLEGDGDAKLGDSSGDLIQITGSVQMNDNVFFLTNGRLGIGTDAPDYKLDVAGNIGINEHIYHNGDADTYFAFSGQNTINLVANGHSFLKYDGAIKINNGKRDRDTKIFADDGNVVLHVDAEASGKVGIGTTTPSVDLDVDGTANATTYQIGGTAITSTAAELNKLDESTVSEASDGSWAIVERIAKATVDSNDWGRGTTPNSLGVTIPDNAILTRVAFDCTQTFAGGDNGTNPFSVVDLALYSGNTVVKTLASQQVIEAGGAEAGQSPYVFGLSELLPISAGITAKLTEELTVKIHVNDDGSGALASLDAGTLDIYIYYIIGA
tara:strand:+ start:5189 stop:6217 length:1029 start_codon:yes stop_codon:yes gene_type:complete